MTFEQADKLMWRILDFLFSCGACYTEDKIRDLQIIVLKALATKQFVIKIGTDGEIRYFACWWFVKDEDLDGVLDYENRVMPADITTGNNIYVAEVASVTGDAREMIRRIKHEAKRENGKAYWHKPHRGGHLYQTVKHARS